MPTKDEWRDAFFETAKQKIEGSKSCAICQLHWTAYRGFCDVEQNCIFYRLYNESCMKRLEREFKKLGGKQDKPVKINNPRIVDLITKEDIPALEAIPDDDPFFS